MFQPNRLWNCGIATMSAVGAFFIFCVLLVLITGNVLLSSFFVNPSAYVRWFVNRFVVVFFSHLLAVSPLSASPA